MYASDFTRLTDEEAQRELVRRVGVAQVVTVGAEGWPRATLLPVLWEGDRLVMHAAAANPQFAQLPKDGAPALAVVTGPNAYVSPSWYPSAAKRGAAVPTWNYLTVHLRGTLTGFAERDRLLESMVALSQRYEAHRPEPWTLESAPARFVDGLLRAVVGLELTIVEVEAKAKLSQNRIAADRAGVIAGLRAEPGGLGSGSYEVAQAMSVREAAQAAAVEQGLVSRSAQPRG